MRDEPAFLQALLAEPTDDGLRLVYADWLEEENGPGAAPKAEFLRRTAQLASEAGGKRQDKARRKRLQQLAAGLDTDWLAVVSRLPVENCRQKRQEAEAQRVPEFRFDYRCDLGWEDLQTTEDLAVRSCDRCRQNVHYCDTIMQAREHAQKGDCIAVDLGVIRHEDDLTPQRRWLGRVSVAMIQEEVERVRPDRVSAEREQRKHGEPARPQERRRRRAARSRNTIISSPVDRSEKVRVRDGTFAGMEGVVQEILEARGAVRVELTIFGRPVPVELEYWQVEQIR